MPKDRAGNSKRSALRVNHQSGKQVYKDWLGPGDREDYYRLKFKSSSNLDISLLRLKADADLEVLNRRGQRIGQSHRSGRKREVLNLQVDQGVYYIRVVQQQGKTRYKLQLQTSEVLSTTPAAPTPQSPPSDWLNTLHPFVNKILELTNLRRSESGLNPLTLNPNLSNAAQIHSEDMAIADFFSHTGSNGSSPFERIAASGYDYGIAAENIAAGFSTPEGVVDGWMNSPGHRANILNPMLKEIGIGYYFLATDTGTVNYHHYWSQSFGTPSNSLFI
ncbi:MAG: CAP domain-containing protein [Synechococcales bacterium]|nr:CAP domain-containing protein [Synechococcales bacterium]